MCWGLHISHLDISLDTHLNTVEERMLAKHLTETRKKKEKGLGCNSCQISEDFQKGDSKGCVLREQDNEKWIFFSETRDRN